MSDTNYFETRVPLLLELGFRQNALAELKFYVDFLWAANSELNLFSRQMPFTDLIDNHVIDCLLPLKFFPADAKVIADFGSGGGLPGVIYAIHFSDLKFELFEKSPKKQDFLNSCKKFARNIEVHGSIPTKLNGIDLVMARGFKPIDVILETSIDYYKTGGKYFLLKARIEKINEELALAHKKIKNLNTTVHPLVSPALQVERHLVLIS